MPQATLAPVIETATITPSPLPTLTLTPTLTPTLSVPTDTPTITPTFDPIRSTPPTITLQRSNNDFDSVQFLREMLAIIKQQLLKVITYQDIYKDPAITAAEKGPLFIITIAAAEAAVAIAIIINLYRRHKSIDVEDAEVMRD